jgi:hypothetical protein
MENNSAENLQPGSIKEFFKSRAFWRPFLGILIGGLAGFLYFHFIGCNSGTCAITSNPYKSVIAGGLFGFLMVNSPCSRGKC